MVNQAYGRCVDCMSQTRRRSCVHFAEYSRSCMSWLDVRAKELLAYERTMFRWNHERRLQSFLDRLANGVFRKPSFRVKRHRETQQLTTDQRESLREQLRKAKTERSTQQHVVFFGDGNFSCTQSGHVSIPKKRLLKLLAVRGVTILLCESFTSKRCPCGHDDLKDGVSSGGVRVRVHRTDGGVCSVLKAVRDRDELACINMMLSASSALRGDSWPAHLTRDGINSNASH